MSRAALAALAVASLSAQAAADGPRGDLWQRALKPPVADLAAVAYERELRDGDEHVAQAAARSGSLAAMRDQVQRAIEAYRRAAAARPTSGEPYYRIGEVLWSFYLQSCELDRYGTTRSPLRDCSGPDAVNVRIAEQTIQAWDDFEARAPLDPRWSGGEDGLLFSRAILHTKLATPEHLAAAARDYEAILQRTDDQSERISMIWGNLAETYMMLGRLDDSIAAYREALRQGARTGTWYGLAVALDRDGRGAIAREAILAQGAGGYRQFRKDVENQSTFFVPRGEVFYYYALAEEAFGLHETALDHWQKFIASGAHPQYQPRAKEHVDALSTARRAGAWPAPTTDPLRWDLTR